MDATIASAIIIMLLFLLVLMLLAKVNMSTEGFNQPKENTP